MTPNDLQAQKNHEPVWELLPWYVNGTLSAHEAALVEGHLPHCAACQQEAKRCGNLAAVAKSTSAEEEVWAPSSRHFAQILSRVEATDTAAGATADWRTPDWRSLVQKLRSWVLDTPRPVQWGFALQAVLIVALASALVLETATTPTQYYETLSRAPQQTTSDRARLRMVFAEDITGGELRDLLQEIEGTMVHGPSPQGVYTVELALPASERERAKAVEAKAVAHPKVLFVAFTPAGGLK